MPFDFEKTEITGVQVVKPTKFEDKRGYFREIYKKSVFEENGIRESFVQDNHSRSKKYVLRGLHFQRPPHAQAKLVRCIRGKVFDVAVDLRKGSPYFKKWVGRNLSEDNGKMLYIPTGFAHGFLSLSQTSDIIYKVTNEYAPDSEAGIFWNDSSIDIDWPLQGEPIVSNRDQKLPTLDKAEINFSYKDRG